MKEPLRVTAIRGHDISTYRLSSGRYMTVWYDSDGQRQRRSRATLKEADELAREVSDALQKKVSGAMTLDDRQAYNLARDLAEPFGYTVLRPCGNGSERRRLIAARKLRKRSRN